MHVFYEKENLSKNVFGCFDFRLTNAIFINNTLLFVIIIQQSW